MSTRGTQSGILDAIPGVRAALRWYGWLGCALLVVPAAALAVLVAQRDGDWVSGWIGVLLLIVGLLALVGAGLMLFMVTSGLRRLGELTQLLCEHSNDPVFVKDLAHRYRFVNEFGATLIARRPADILGRRDSDLRPADEALAFEENDRVCFERDLPTMFREAQTTLGGGTRSFLVSKRPLHDTRGRISGLIGAARDITDELELQKLTRRRKDEMRALFDANPLPAVVFSSADLRILKVNAAAEKKYGYGRQRLLTMRLPELFARDEADRLRQYLQDVAQAVPPGGVAWRHRMASGEEFEVNTDIGNLPHAEAPSRVMLVRDISREHATRTALEECSAHYEDLIESGLTMVWMHDMEGRLLKVNSTMANALGYEGEDMLGRGLADFVTEDAHASWDDYMARVRSLRRDGGVLYVSARNGEQRVWQYEFVCYPDARPVPYILGTAQDVTLRHRYELRMRDQNRRDPLTGCHTRRYLEAFAWQATNDQKWGCVVVDADYFRQVNASEGEERGDILLRELAGLLGHSAGSNDAVVRLGGDEFAVVIPHATAAGVQELAERLSVPARDGMPVAFSLGWALRESGEPMESTLRRADKMLMLNRAHERGL